MDVAVDEVVEFEIAALTPKDQAYITMQINKLSTTPDIPRIKGMLGMAVNDPNYFLELCYNFFEASEMDLVEEHIKYVE